MADNILNMTAVAEALKYFYLDGLRYQLNSGASVFLTQLERDSTAVQGGKIIMALRYGRNGGVGNRADDGDLPTPNSRKTKQAKWETKNIYARIQITDKTMKASRGDRGAFANLLEADLEDCQNDAKDMLSRQVLMDGTGALATIASVATKTCTIAAGETDFFAEGMRVDIYNADSLVQGDATVDAVDETNSTVTLSAVGSAAGTHKIYQAGNKGLELTGVKAVFEATTLYELVRADNLWLTPTRTNVAGEISEVIVQKMIDEAERKAKSVINFLIGSYGVRRAYQNLLTAQKIIAEVMELKGGYKAISYNGLPFTVDKYMRSGKLYGLDLNDWKMYELEDWDWMDSDGAMLHRVSGKPAWEATLTKYCDLGCQKPRGQAELYGITEH